MSGVGTRELSQVFGQDLLERCEFQRLEQIVVDARLDRALLVVRVALARQCDDPHLFEAPQLANCKSTTRTRRSRIAEPSAME